jgi:hypothetical protein
LSDAFRDDRGSDAQLAGRSREAPDARDDEKGVDVLQSVDGGVPISTFVRIVRKLIARFVQFCCASPGVNVF